MACKGLHHFNISCSAADLPAIEKFYGEVLGLRVGYRPAFPNAGLWLYLGDHPVVHVAVRYRDDWNRDTVRGGFDHVAFSMTGAAELNERLRRLGYQFDPQNVPEAGFQIFLTDPVGNKVELNFPQNEALAEIATGTLSATQFPRV